MVKHAVKCLWFEIHTKRESFPTNIMYVVAIYIAIMVVSSITYYILHGTVFSYICDHFIKLYIITTYTYA